MKSMGSKRASRWTHVMRKIFLPQDYPEGITADYYPFHLWTALQNISASAMYVLCTQALLTAASASSAAFSMAIGVTWVLKDGFGCLGSLFASGKFGSRLDGNPKRYKWLADVGMNFGILLDILTPLFPMAFLAIGSISNAIKSLALLVASSTRMCMVEGFAANHNFGDIIAKLHAQSTTCFFLGICLGIPITTLCEENLPLRLAFFSLLTVGHMYCSYRALSAVQLLSLNTQRSAILIQHYLDSINGNGADGVVLSPKDVCERETFIHPYSLRNDKNIILGSDFSTLVGPYLGKPDSPNFQTMIDLYGKEMFLIYSPYSMKKRCDTPDTQGPDHSRSDTMHIILHKDHIGRDRVKALFTAFIIQKLAKDPNWNNSIPRNGGSHDETALCMSEILFPQFIEQLKGQGWGDNYDPVILETETKCTWDRDE